MASERRSIGKSLIAGCVLFVLLYGLLLGAIGYNSYRNGLYQSFNMYLDNLLRLTLTQIDGDDLATCIQTLEHSPAYDQLQTFLDKRAYKLIQESLPATDEQPSAAPADPGSEA